jgi:hypothetical protein
MLQPHLSKDGHFVLLPALVAAEGLDLIRRPSKLFPVQPAVAVGIQMMEQVAPAIRQCDQQRRTIALFDEVEESLEFGTCQLAVAVAVGVRKKIGQELQGSIVLDLSLLDMRGTSGQILKLGHDETARVLQPVQRIDAGLREIQHGLRMMDSLRTPRHPHRLRFDAHG